MKRTKNVFRSLFAVALAVLLLIPVFALCASAEEYSIFKYEISNGEASITRCNNVSGEVIIPDEIDGCPVTCIGEKAFYSYGSTSKYESIIIPDSVKIIGDKAFESCQKLKSINIPNSVTTIGNRAFYDCTNLANVTIGNSVKTIGDSAFSCCQMLKNIIIPNSVTTIGDNAFKYSYRLESIAIPDSVTNIGNGAFWDCFALTSIIIPDSVTAIGDSTFCECYNLVSVSLSNSITSIGTDAFYQCYNLGNIEIPDSVTTIGDFAFCECHGLESITITESVTSIGDNTFKECEKIKICCYRDSYAHKYAVKNNINYMIIPIDSVTVNDVEINYKDSAKIIPEIVSVDGAKYTVEFSSSDPSVVTVDKNGNIYGAGKGSAKITCTVTDENGSKVEDTCTVTVKLQWWQWIIRILLLGFLWY